jgi:putative spermidine/putrescine transport system permease protein
LLLLGPALLLVAGFVLIPTAMALIESFHHGGSWTVANYFTILTEAPYPRVLWNTATIAAATALVSVAVAAPLAAFLAAQHGNAARLVLGLVAATLWISILVKLYAWQVLLARTGPLNALLQQVNITTPQTSLLYTRGAVLVAMVQVMVPYASMLLIAGMKRIDWDLIVAARTLGARLPLVFTAVYWPQVRYSVVMTTLVIFVSASGFFVAPALVGGSGEIMIGMKMQSDLVNQYDSGLAATAGTVLMVGLLLLSWIALKLSGTSFRRLAEEVGS